MRWTRTAVPFCASGIEAILLLSQSCFLFPWLALSAKMPHPTPTPPPKKKKERKKGRNRRRLLGIQRVLAPPMELDSYAWAILHHQYKTTLICSSLCLSASLHVCPSSSTPGRFSLLTSLKLRLQHAPPTRYFPLSSTSLSSRTLVV